METFFYLFFGSLVFEYVLTLTLASGYTLKLPYLFGLIFLAYFLYSVYRKRVKLDLKLEEILLLLFAFLSYLTFFWSIDRQKTLLISSMILFAVLIFYASRRLLTGRWREIVLKFFVWLGLATSLFAFWQFFGDAFGLSQKLTFLNDRYTSELFSFPRVQSTFFEPGYFANFLFIPLFLSIYFFFKEAKKNYLYLLFVISIAFFLTLSRSGLYAIIISSLTLVFIFLKNREYLALKRLFSPIKVVFVAFVFSLIMVFSVAGSVGIKNYLYQTKNLEDFVGYSDDSFQMVTRSYTMKIAFETFKSKPFGIGMGAFGSLPEFQRIREDGNPRQTVNSLYPEILAEGGILALVSFLSFIIYLLYTFLVRRAKKDYLSIFLGATVLAIFVQYVSFSTLYFLYIWVFLAVALESRGGLDEARS